MNDITLKIWLVGTLLLTLKMWANTAVQAHARFRNKIVTIPEDARAFSTLLKTEVTLAAEEHPLCQRAAACWRNDLENIPLFMILSLGYTLIGGDPQWLLIYVSVFVFARVLHTFFYLNQLQPWRTIIFEIGSLVTMALVAHDAWLVFTR